MYAPLAESLRSSDSILLAGVDAGNVFDGQTVRHVKDEAFNAGVKANLM